MEEHGPEQVPQSILVHWQAKSPWLFLDQEPRVLLLVEAIHEIAILHFRVDGKELDGQPGPALVLGQTPPVYGVRRWRVETSSPGKNYVRACGNFLLRPGQVVPVLSAQIPAGHDFWLWAGQSKELILAPGQAVAVCGTAAEPCKVKVEMAGL